MKMKSTLVIAILVGILSSCGTPTENDIDGNVEVLGFDTAAFLNEVKSVELALNQSIPSKDTLSKAIKLFQNYANNFPEDGKAADYLLKTSDLYLALNDPKNCVKILDRLIDTYPEYDKIENAYFNRANHIDFEIRDTTLAKEYYNEFIAKFPQSELVGDAEARIEFISLSLEELMEKFEKMNAE